MNLVNGWQYTGMGPFYIKDSSTAQNILSGGIASNLALSGVADVVESVAGLSGQLQSARSIDAEDPAVTRVVETLQAHCIGMEPMTIPNFAEIHVYEPQVSPDGCMSWVEVTSLSFNRDYLGTKQVCIERIPTASASGSGEQQSARIGAGGGLQSARTGGISADVARAAVAGVFGVPTTAFGANGQLQSGSEGPAFPAGNVNQQVQVDCGEDDDCKKSCELNFLNFGHHDHHKERPLIQRKAFFGAGFEGSGTVIGGSSNTSPNTPAGGAGPGLQSATTAADAEPHITNTLNLNVEGAGPGQPKVEIDSPKPAEDAGAPSKTPALPPPPAPGVMGSDFSKRTLGY
jgi:hypothetical protein